MWLKGPKKPYPWSWGNLSVHSHFAHAEGGRNWMIHMLLTTVESYLSSLFGITQKCLARQCANCISACMNIGMISEGGKMWGDSFDSYVYVGFRECVKYANVCMWPVFEKIFSNIPVCMHAHSHIHIRFQT